jgi:nucleotide-binding universal stress UspA family protein/hemerythrin-like domain-containing protein
MYKHLLVPIDGSATSLGLIDQAVAYAKAAHAHLSFFHASRDLAATGTGAMLLSADPQAFAASAVAPGLALLAKAEAAARAEQLPCDATQGISDHVSDAILDTAERLGCDLVFIASRGRKGWATALSGSVTRQLIEAARLPVLVTCIDAQIRQTARFRALSIIREEHRSLAAVLHGLEHLAQQWRADPRAQDFRLLGAMLYYVEHFPERLHHPKEETQIFVRLAQRTTQFDALLQELRAQHSAGAEELKSLQARLAAFEQGVPDAGVRFFDEAMKFVAGQWHHMGTEERLILPAAASHLTDDDWQAVALAFEGHTDPQFRRDTGASFEQLFARIAQVAGDALTTRT